MVEIWKVQKKKEEKNHFYFKFLGEISILYPSWPQRPQLSVVMSRVVNKTMQLLPTSFIWRLIASLSNPISVQPTTSGPYVSVVSNLTCALGCASQVTFWTPWLTFLVVNTHPQFKRSSWRCVSPSCL